MLYRENGEQFPYHRGQRIDDGRTPTIAAVREALADWSHVIMTPRILPVTIVRISATAFPPERTNLYAS